MLLPGISGSYILTILGVYPFAMAAVTGLNADFLGQLLIGIVIGALLFSRVITFLLHRFYSVTLAMLTGFMLGSLPAVWPFFTFSQKGVEWVMPDLAIFSNWISLGITVAAFFSVIAIEKISLYTSKKSAI
jgi:putative membrane protein